MHRSQQSTLAVIVLGLCALAIAGCGAPEPELAHSDDGATSSPTVESADSSHSQGEAVLEYGENTYTAALNFCSLAEGEDALFHGVAQDETGQEVGYLEGDFGVLDGNLHGEARIDFGATEKFQSTDQFIAVGDALSNIVATDFSDTSWIVMGGGWDQDGVEQGNAVVKVTC